MTPQPATDPVWSALLPGVRAEALDCLQSNLALLADHLRGPGTHHDLGRELAFVREIDGRLQVARDPAERSAEAERLLRLAVARHEEGLDGPALRALAAGSAPMFVVADAFGLGWCPYAGREHMAHSFLLAAADDTGCVVVDAYHNDTEWGAARPGVWRLTTDEFDECITAPAAARTFTVGPGPGDRPTAAASLRENAAAARRAARLIDRYVEQTQSACADPAGMQAYVLDVWLLCRSRRLHHAWVRTVDTPDAGAGAGEQVARWSRLAAQSYVVSRRVRRGGSVPASVMADFRGLLEEDVRIAESYGDAASPARCEDPAVRAMLVETLSELLGAEPATIEAAPTLRDVPGFNSFKLMDVIDDVEARLGVLLPAEAFTAESLRDVDSLAGLFVAAGTDRPVVRT